MTKSSDIPAAATHLQVEHAYLGGLLEQLGRDLASECCTPAALADELTELLQVLERHFVEEEESGYFAAIRSAAPQSQYQVERLERQHRQFRADLRSMQRLCYARMWGLDRTSELRETFGEFLRSLEIHERTERSLHQESLTRDLGAAD